MDFWSKGLRGGDNGVTPRRGPWSKPSTSSVSAQPEKTKADKPVTPGGTSGCPSSRTATLRKPAPIVTDGSEGLTRPDSPSQPASVYSGDGDADGTEDFENDSVRVFVRVRPPTQQELEHEKHEECLTVIGSRTVELTVKEKQNTAHRFMFDQVLPEETPQSDVFDLAGLVAVDNCLAGYNSSIFAYGQTGAGKTFTVIGQISSPENRGLAPRVFDYLFAKITDHENARGPDTVKYNCRCAFLEIYNETIADLLCPSSTNLPIREDPEKGPYVDGLSEPPALNVDEMLQHLLRGAENRHTGETRLNRESSRSHSVFMCTVEKTVTSNDISKCFYAKLNLVDLAGSERIASGAHGGSNATGEHFKEACHINKSLTALGRVTTELVKSQKNGGGGHVPYRDSKLTFLLQSSLGGNAKTLIIANISPSAVCAQETLSTLRFAKQTKHIRNDAKVNWTVQGDRLAMQREIERLRMELAGTRMGLTEPLVQANEELTARLEEERQRREELQQERDRAANALSQARREIRLLDQRLVGLAQISGIDGNRGAGVLATVVEQLASLLAGDQERRQEIAEAEEQLLTSQLQAEQEKCETLALQLGASNAAKDGFMTRCETLEGQLLAVEKEKADLEESCSVLADNFSRAGAQIKEQKEQLEAQQSSLAVAVEQIQELERQLHSERTLREAVERQLAAAQDEAERAASHTTSLTQLLEDRDAEMNQQGNLIEGLKRQLEGALAEVQALQSRLSEAQEQLALTQHESTASRSQLADQVSQLTAQLEASEAKAADDLAILEEQRRSDVSARDQRVAEVDEELRAKSDECAAALRRVSALELDIAAQTEARAAAEAEVASLSDRLLSLQDSLTVAEARSAAEGEQLQKTRDELEQLNAQLTTKTAALEEALSSSAAAQQELVALNARAQALEHQTAEQAAAHAALGESYQTAEHELTHLRATTADLEGKLASVQGLLIASEQRTAALNGKVADMEARTADLVSQVQALEASKAGLEARTSKQAAEAQELSAASSRLEACVAELESSKLVLAELLKHEQDTVSSCRETIAQHEACITELRQRIEQEEVRTLSAHREMSESTAAFQRQIAELEEQHLKEVKKLKDDLDRRSSELKARDQEMVRTNFELKKEIDRLHASLEQAKRELAAGKANQEQLVASHHTAISGMTERLNKQAERYNELTQKHDALKVQLDHAQREVEAWKTKHGQLDRAMGDITRLIGFVRNPPDSARSSLIMARSEHLSSNLEGSRRVSGTPASRAGLPGGAGTGVTPGSLAIRVTESPAQSPRVSTSRYSASSPYGSKVGSVSINAGRRLHACEDDEWDSTRQLPDVVSPGDQLPIPDMDD